MPFFDETASLPYVAECRRILEHVYSPPRPQRLRSFPSRNGPASKTPRREAAIAPCSVSRPIGADNCYNFLLPRLPTRLLPSLLTVHAIWRKRVGVEPKLWTLKSRQMMTLQLPLSSNWSQLEAGMLDEPRITEMRFRIRVETADPLR
jgi:hypothetical protein